MLSSDTEMIPVNDAGAVIPGQPSMQTVWRWVLSGIRGPTGDVVKLGSVKIGGRRFVTRAAIEQFISALNTDQPPAESPEAPSTAQKRANEAGKALEALGA